MADTFLTGIEIKKVRHLQNISIPLSAEKREREDQCARATERKP